MSQEFSNLIPPIYTNEGIDPLPIASHYSNQFLFGPSGIIYRKLGYDLEVNHLINPLNDGRNEILFTVRIYPKEP